MEHVDRCHPLTSPQREIWLDQALHPDSPMYNIGGYLSLARRIDFALFQRAMRQWMRRHDALRTVLVHGAGDDGLPMQACSDAWEPPLERHDFSADADPHAAALAWMQASMAQPLPLQGQPLFRCALLTLGPDRCYWFKVCHHLIADGWTIAMLTRSLGEIYTALERGDAMPPDAPSYTAFIDDDRAYVESPAWQSHRAYWQERYRHPPQPLVSRRVTGACRSECLSVTWPRRWYDAVESFASIHDASPFHVVMAALYVYFTRSTQRSELVVGLPVLNRSSAAFKATAGLFVGLSPVRLDFGTALGFGELLRAIRRELRQVYRRQRFPTSEIRRAAGLDAGSALFDVSISYERQDYESHFGDTPGRAHALLNHQQQMPLTVFIREFHTAEPVRCDYVFNRAFFDASEIDALQSRVMNIIDAAMRQPDVPVDLMPVLTNDEREQVSRWGRGPAVPVPHDTFARAFSQRAAAHPHRLAAVCGGDSLTYGALDRRANAIAHALVAAGAGRDTVVALLAPRGIPLLTMMLGTLKAGAAFLNLDVRQPSQRLQEILALSAAPLVVCTNECGRMLERVVAGMSARCLVADALWRHDAPQVPVQGSGSDLAYVVFTSGSTGVPKGAMVEQRSLMNVLQGKVHTLGLREGERSAQTIGVSFDPHVAQFLAPALAGATVQVLPEEITQDPLLLLQAADSAGVVALETVPSLLRALLQHCPPELALAALRRLVVGGEALAPGLAAAWLERFPHTELVNEYGPAECAITSSCQVVRSAQEAQALAHLPSVPIGRAMPNVQLHILDERQQPLPPGTAGEICIGGMGVGRGYLGDPVRSREAFVEHPQEPGSRLYRTGDLARFGADGIIHFIGRRDQQVKLRGQRIELGEVESRLRCLPGVRDAAAAIRHDPPGEAHLIAYLTAEAAAECAWREALAASLPLAMVPSRFIVLDSLPLNANGKVDHSALPEPDWTATDLGDAHEAPVTPTEKALAILWSTLLRVECPGRRDDFFQRGGHSLLAMQLISRIRQQLGVSMPLAAVFEHRRLHELARRIDSARDPGAAGELQPQPVPRTGCMPASFAQRRLWFLERLAPGAAHYNLPLAVRLSGPLDDAALEQALRDLIDRHEALRTALVLDADGEPVQRVVADPPFSLARSELGMHVPGERIAKAHDCARREAMLPFDLQAAPLMRARLLVLQPRQEHWLVLIVHHAVADGWSLDLLIADLAQLYDARRHGRAPSLAPPRLQYIDCAEWQRRWLDGPAAVHQREHWRERLRGVTQRLDLPFDRPRPGTRSHRGAHLPFAITRPVAHRLRQLAREADATLFMALLGAFGALLHRFSGQEDFCIGAPVGNRVHADFEPVVGMFVNTLALRMDFSGQPSFADVLGRVQRTALDAYAHQELPFEQVVDAAQAHRDPAIAPLFQVMFALENPIGALDGFADLQAEPLPIEYPVAKFDLTLALIDHGEAIEGYFEYDTDLFDAPAVERLAAGFDALLAAVVADDQRPVRTIGLLDEAGHRRWIDEWNTPRSALAEGDSYLELFAERVARTPELPAVRSAERVITFGELDAQAGSLARRLHGLGIAPDDIVGLCVERSIDMVVAMLGVLKAGAAYMPLDPLLPPARLAHQLQDAKPVLLVGHGDALARLPEHAVATLVLEDDAAPARAAVPAPAAPRTHRDHLAYIIYTSGSTGQPKGVAVTHGALHGYVQAMQAVLRLRPGQRVLQFTPYTFDVSIDEIFVSLLAGACVVTLPREDILPGPPLREALRRHAIDVLAITPSALAVVPAEPLPLELIVLGGERSTQGLVEQWLPHCRVVNAYGPTECTVSASVHECHSGESRDPAIGRPLANTRLYVLDADLNPVPPGVVGELHIGGTGLARGYLARPALTAERFIADPFARTPGARMYRSGDRVRLLAEGRLEYLGRNDDQVKLRGLRIELGEIESALLQLPRVRQAAVMLREDTPQHPQLVAYVVQEGRPDTATLRSALQARLPRYMVPAHIVALDRMPLNASDKIDRRALPAPSPDASLDDGRAHAPPRTDTERRLAQEWTQLLQLDSVGRDDHFFECGGHSLLATRLAFRIESVFGVELPVRALFEAPTLSTMAQRIDAGSQTRAHALPPLTRLDDRTPVPLSFAQARMWFLDRLNPGSAHYNVPSAFRLRGELDVPRLQRSLQAIVERHEVLRTVFTSRAGQAVATVLPQMALRVDIERPQGWEERMAALARQPFDLAHGPLLRVALFPLAPSDHVLLLVLHHVVCDGWSFDVLLGELAAHYDNDGCASLPPLAFQYADFADWQRRCKAGGHFDAQLAYWQARLDGAAAPLSLPTDRPRPATQSHRGDSVALELDAAVCGDLRQVCRDADATVFMALAAAFNMLLALQAGAPEICLGVPVTRRPHPSLEPLIGLFVNTVVLRTRCDPDSSFHTLLGEVRRNALEAYTHADVPFDHVVEALRVDRSLSHSPLAQVMFVLQEQDRATSWSGPQLEPIALPSTTSQLDLSLELWERDGALQGFFEYATDLFDRPTIERMAGCFRALLPDLLRRPHQPMRTLPSVVEMETQRHQAAGRPIASGLMGGPRAARARAAPIDRATPHVAPATATEAALAALWTRLLGRSGIGRYDDFFHAGGHSLLAVQLMEHIEAELGVRLPLAHLFTSSTIEALAGDIDRHRLAPPAAASLLVPLQTRGDAAPLVLFHPAGGTVFCYAALARALAGARPCHALQSPEAAGWPQSPQTWDALCALYADVIHQQWPEGPLGLAGWSMGGSLALHVGWLLEGRGREIESISLFDTVMPDEHDDGVPASMEAFVDWVLKELPAQVVGQGAVWQQAHARASRHASLHGTGAVAAPLGDDAALQAFADASGIDAGFLRFVATQHRVQASHAQLLRAFMPRRVQAPLNVVHAAATVPRADWLRFTHGPARSSVRVLPGTHETVVARADNVQAIAELLSPNRWNGAQQATDKRALGTTRLAG